MFFCIGENQSVSCSSGKGQTVADAIKDWAYTVQWNEIADEFNQYDPVVIAGDELVLEIEFPEPIITIRK